MLSIAGVCRFSFPAQLIAPAYCWSVNTYRMFGLLGTVIARVSLVTLMIEISLFAIDDRYTFYVALSNLQSGCASFADLLAFRYNQDGRASLAVHRKSLMPSGRP
jgi:hypothetical protein